MNYKNAREVNQLMLDVSKQLDQSLGNVQASESQSDFEIYRSAVAKIMEIMLFEIMNPIYKQYAELEPDELK